MVSKLFRSLSAYIIKNVCVGQINKSQTADQVQNLQKHHKLWNSQLKPPSPRSQERGGGGVIGGIEALLVHLTDFDFGSHSHVRQE